MTSRPERAPMAEDAAGHPAARLTRGPSALQRWSARVLALAGGRCAVCRGWCDGGLCHPCHARFAVARDRCEGCGLPHAPADAHAPTSHCLRCRLAPPPWSRLVVGVDYGYPWDGQIAGLKFHRRLDALPVLLQPLRARLDDMRGSDVRVVAVPLSRERLRERGYNQAWELARRLARGLALEARADALFRVRDTGHQLGLRRAARGANLRGAFVATPRHAAWVRGARIALVDDVFTTGATAHAATRALLVAGAREVQVWVVACTPER